MKGPVVMTEFSKNKLSRREQIEAKVCDMLSEISSPTERIRSAAHLFGTARMAVLIAKKRGLDEDLAYLAGLLHDLRRFMTGISREHGPHGAALAGSLLEDADILDRMLAVSYEKMTGADGERAKRLSLEFLSRS